MPKAVYRSGFYQNPVTAHSGIRTLVLSPQSGPLVYCDHCSWSAKLLYVGPPYRAPLMGDC